ncbi:MAG: GNAT family N-acetyltransferase [Saprospiraceae bacterium]|nr:GNAT family N-acetyltransferase [Saprospiraceae bacterium]
MKLPEVLPERLTIREGRKADQQALIDFLADCLAEFDLALDFDGTDRDLLEIEQAYRDGYFGVIESGDTLAGTFALFPLSDDTAEIRKMYLSAEWRGRGLGRQLLATLEDMARRKGFQRIELETASPMHAAIHVYQSSGYREMPASGCGNRCDRRFFKQLA